MYKYLSITLSLPTINLLRSSCTPVGAEILYIPMASLVPSQPGRHIPARSYSAEAWEQNRMIISQLYRDEARSLNDVLVILAQEYDFRPTYGSLIASDLSL